MGDTKLEDLSRRFQEITRGFANQFELLRMMPTDDSVDAYQKGCVAKTPGTNNFPIGMQLLNSIPQTYESCKVGASLEFSNIKYNEMQQIKKNDIQKIPGLQFKVVDGYFLDNPAYFINGNSGNPPTVLSSGETQNMSDFNTSTKSFIRGQREFFSIEWQGYIIPDATGNWKISITSDDASYLWIGNHALYDYKTSNAQIKNGGLHGPKTREGSIYLIKGQVYPLRIQYGNNAANMTFNFTISSPSGENKTNSIIFILKKDGKFYEMKQRYFALVDSANPGYYSCYVADTGDDAQNNAIKVENISRTSEAQATIQRALWKGLNQTNANDARLIKPGNYARFNINANDASLVLYDSRGGELKRFFIESKSNMASNPELRGFLLRGGGEVYLKVLYRQKNGSEAVKYIGKTRIPGDSIASETFVREIIAKRTSNQSKPNYMNINDRIDNSRSLFSSDNKFKLTIDPNGNLVILYAIQGCKPTSKNLSGEDVMSNKYNESARFLYALDVDEKQNKYFYSKNIAGDQVVEMIPASSDSKNGGVLGYDRFINVGNYLPDIGPNFNFSLANKEQCEKTCKDDPTCNSYNHVEVKFNTGSFRVNYELCFTPKGSNENIIAPNSMNPIPPFAKDYLKSSLYIKDKHLDMSSNYMTTQLGVTNIDTYNGYSLYSAHDVSGGYFSTPKVIATESTSEWQDANNDLQKILWGTRGRDPVDEVNTAQDNEPEGFTFVREGLTYLNRNCSGNTADGCIRDISNNKIAPLKEMAANYERALQQLSQNRIDLSNNITNYNNLKQNLLDNDNTYKYSDAVDQTNPDKKTLLDGMNDDANEMLLQQNNVYLMGTLTTASLLILAIILSSK